MERYARVKVPNHDNLVIAPAGNPPARVCPAHTEHRPGMHSKRAKGLGRTIGELGGMAEDGFGAPDADLCVESTGSDTRAVGMNMD